MISIVIESPWFGFFSEKMAMSEGEIKTIPGRNHMEKSWNNMLLSWSCPRGLRSRFSHLAQDFQTRWGSGISPNQERIGGFSPGVSLESTKRILNGFRIAESAPS